MQPAEVIRTANQPHRSAQARFGVGHGSPPTHQGRQRRAQGGGQPLDVRGLDPGAAAGGGQHRRDGGFGPPHDPVFEARHTPLHIPLDHLAQEQPGLLHQAGPSAAAGADRMPEHPREGCDIAGQPIHTDQDGQATAIGPNQLDQRGEQDQVAMGADGAAQPQPRWARPCPWPSTPGGPPASPTARPPGRAAGPPAPAGPRAAAPADQ